MWNKVILKKREPLLWVVSGPSGSGKTTIYQALLRKEYLNIERSVSFTSRPLKKGEKRHKDYVFISKEEFLKQIKNNELIEWQEVFGNLYGTSKKLVYDLFKKNKDVLLCIDVRGALEIKKQFSKRVVLVFILPPSERELTQRIKARARDENEEIKKRLAFVKTELAVAKEYDYIIVNDNLSKAVKELESIIITKGLENVLRAT